MGVSKIETLEFDDLHFSEDKDSGKIKIIFLKYFVMEIGKEEFNVGKYELHGHKIMVERPGKIDNILSLGFSRLKSVITGNDAVYVHQNSGIPLFGTLYFGIVDRGTNIIELKPVTGCNIDCIFCSVAESSKSTDYVVEKDYLISEFKKLIEFKREGLDDEKKIDVYVNTHGEPLLYADIVGLVKGLRKVSEVGVISIITNGILLTENLIEELAQAGLSQLNISINALDSEVAKKLAGSDSYDIDKLMEQIKYAASKMDVVLAPVMMKNVNEEEMKPIVEFASDTGATMGIQNYMAHKKGRKAAKEMKWEEFYGKLEELEKETGVSLKLPVHEVFSTKALDKPFRKGDVISVEIVCDGRGSDEMLGAAQGRVVLVYGAKRKGTAKVKLMRDKDGIFVGKAV